MRKLVLALFLMAASAASTGAADDGEPQSGAALSRTWCASCHLIGTDDTQVALADAPSFVEVAKTMGETRREALAMWLTRPHDAMPDPSLTRAEIADILAYIESLAP
ncbi:MAG: cytochrome C552 [Hyphomicrobiales bacterium]|nr:cytochrome C552 [Hyphomicrobiales bacterium]